MTTPLDPAERTFAVVNARIFTADPRRPWADGLLVAGDRLVLLGSSAEVRKRAGPSARVVDARRGMVLPAAMEVRHEAGFAEAAARARDGAGALRTGATASFVLLDRDLSARGRVPDAPARVMLAVAAGQVVHDPDGALLP